MKFDPTNPTGSALASLSSQLDHSTSLAAIAGSVRPAIPFEEFGRLASSMPESLASIGKLKLGPLDSKVKFDVGASASTALADIARDSLDRPATLGALSDQVRLTAPLDFMRAADDSSSGALASIGKLKLESLDAAIKFDPTNPTGSALAGLSSQLDHSTSLAAIAGSVRPAIPFEEFGRLAPSVPESLASIGKLKLGPLDSKVKFDVGASTALADIARDSLDRPATLGLFDRKGLADSIPSALDSIDRARLGALVHRMKLDFPETTTGALAGLGSQFDHSTSLGVVADSLRPSVPFGEVGRLAASMPESLASIGKLQLGPLDSKIKFAVGTSASTALADTARDSLDRPATLGLFDRKGLADSIEETEGLADSTFIEEESASGLWVVKRADLFWLTVLAYGGQALGDLTDLVSEAAGVHLPTGLQPARNLAISLILIFSLLVDRSRRGSDG